MVSSVQSSIYLDISMYQYLDIYKASTFQFTCYPSGFYCTFPYLQLHLIILILLYQKIAHGQLNPILNISRHLDVSVSQYLQGFHLSVYMLPFKVLLHLPHLQLHLMFVCTSGHPKTCSAAATCVFCTVLIPASLADESLSSYVLGSQENAVLRS